MTIMLIGLNHRTAPVEIREQLAFSSEGVSTALMLLRNQYPGCEAAILSTCNRVEVLVASEQDHPTENEIISFLAQARDLPVRSFKQHLYRLKEEQAVRHLFRVASSLDSMVVGENQIISQVKTAFAQASEQGTTGRLLNRLFHQAFCAAKRVHSETEIGRRKVSVPSVAVDVAKSIFSNFADKHVLVIGAGEMAQLVCQHLRQADARNFTVTSRTLNNARVLAEACDGSAVPYDQLDEQLANADIVVTATRCPKPIITAERINAIQKIRRRRPMFLIDLAVPRNVDPAAGELGSVYLYDIDELGRIVAENQRHRMNQIDRCERILDDQIDAFDRWMAESRARPLIQQLYQDAQVVHDRELEDLFAACSGLTDEQRAAILQATQRLVNKFMHPCAYALKRHSGSGVSATLANTLHEIAQKQPDNGAGK
jgi:glutamyl-tRNA reductase